MKGNWDKSKLKKNNQSITILIKSANVFIGRSRRDQQMSGSANVQVESANGRLAEISKCLSQQMSKSSQLKSRQQMSVSKSPVGKCQIGVYSHTKKPFISAAL